ncbi:hypothetical protein DV738_g3059, partial [Chaetothyriales sp. CBS 135597]
MASVSVSSPIVSHLSTQLPSRSPRRLQQRMPSKMSSSEPLPAFSFHPATVERADRSESGDDEKPDERKPDERKPDEHKPDENTMDTAAKKPTTPRPALPDFKFNPGAGLQTERSPSPTHPVLQEMALNQQRAARSARPGPLSSFTLLTHSVSAETSPSPTKSGFADTPHSGGMGHRRRGSEFVGGAGGAGGAATVSQLVSSSPEKAEYRPPPVTGYPRGHSHRRSQAVSISDIDTSDLIKASALSKSRAELTPTTPSESQTNLPFTAHSSTTPTSRRSISLSQSPASSPRRRDSAPGARPRVGFADRVDVIPRPLSLISSETEGSCSTIRGGHSLSGSINSIASPTPKPPTVVAPPVLFDPESPESPPQRPKTADDATLLSASTTAADRSLLVGSLPKRPLSASSSPAVTLSGSPPTKKKHFWPRSNPGSPLPTPKTEGRHSLEAATALPALPPTMTATPTSPRVQASPQRSASVKKRKYSTWTAGIFSKRARKRSLKVQSKRVPTPPLQRRTSDKINKIFDQDDTVVLREPSPVSQRSAPRPVTAYAVPSATFSSPQTEDSEAATLDLDAALSFGDDNGLHDLSGRSGTSRYAKLHSSERRSLDAFGVLHKRAESAPLMQPVNRSLFNMQRMGSNSSIRDEVFDEEEEDFFLAHKSNGESESDTGRSSSTKMEQAVPADGGLSDALAEGVDGLGLSVGAAPVSDAVVIVDPDDEITAAEQRSSKSTIEAPVPSDQFIKRPATSPMIFPYSEPRSTYASSTEGRTTSASMISSPDADHISFDNLPRTARYLTEPSSEYILKTSNEDLPSLSDSISSGVIPRFSSSANTASSIEQRSASVCVPSTSRSQSLPWKRASLASLNRLIPGSANGSKLKFEATPYPAQEEKAKKKTNRLSKLMNFWRSKEKGEASA